MTQASVRILNILGREYRIRTADSEYPLLLQASERLQQQLAEHQRLHPAAASHELLVLTALNLCLPLLEQEGLLRTTQERLEACVQRIQQQQLP